MGSVIVLPKPKAAAHNQIVGAALEEWRRQWPEYNKDRQTMQFFPNQGHGKAKELLRLDRRNLSGVISSTMGHGLFGISKIF